MTLMFSGDSVHGSSVLLQPCNDAFYDYIQDNILLIAGVAIGFGVVMVTALLFVIGGIFAIVVSNRNNVSLSCVAYTILFKWEILSLFSS